MEVIYNLILSMIILGLLFSGVLFLAIKKGQYDDLEGDGQRILMDYAPKKTGNRNWINAD